MDFLLLFWCDLVITLTERIMFMFTLKEIDWFFQNGHITMDEVEEMIMESMFGIFWMECGFTK